MNLTRHALLATTALGLLAGAAQAQTLRWAAAGDALTLDPHAQNEGPTHTMNHQIYEPLLLRNTAGDLEGALATDWQVSEEDPNVWIFTLRDGVTFHGGQEFDAEDVIFSIERAQSPNSGMKELLGSIVEVRAGEGNTVEFVTDGPNPILPANLTNLFIMDQGWAEENDATEVQDYAAGEQTYAAANTNGTGPFQLSSREADVRTVLEVFPDYWGMDEFPMAIERVEFTPIQNAATRVAALLSGEVDFVQDVPVQDLERVQGSDGLEVITAPQNRTIFFGMNVGADDIENDDVDGENPFSKVEVRQAMNMALNRDAIQRVVMRGQSDPTGIIIPPFVQGWTEELNAPPEGDMDAARQLLEEGGYPDGFSVQLDCPNDRYINDEAICQAVVGMMSQIGINVNLNAMPKAQFFPLIENGTTDFYLLGWGVPTFDSEYVFNFLVHTKDDSIGTWNATGYSNPELDSQIESLSSMTDLDARDQEIADIWATVQEETIYLPLHNQVLNWGIADGFETEVQPEDQPKVKYFETTGS
ncbi:ABC transporter substrate-binding protein [Palleronia sp. LCG004]|uniref:ABC transporter substrate-binding protein n=1 Tax=Palleronia sp. LCG004 TaxID=3079304 RepID=UPI00294350AA|nr:ABC transporter substrate-binding protein [Palleronia sp. LCG004]WOI56859.1 ABC transporter substrate-binding protein [Palleronia sp. LCG004]